MSSFKFLFGHYYFDLLQEEKIKLLFENENSYSRTLEGLSSIFAKASPEMKALILESWKG
jgi:magnesium-transporting ATPase (P-type)